MGASNRTPDDSGGEPRDILWALVEDLLAGRLGVPGFESRYYDYYLEKVPSEALSDREAQFFGLIQEKLDWTAEHPAPEERKFGWLDHPGYVAWVRRLEELHLAGEALRLS